MKISNRLPLIVATLCLNVVASSKAALITEWNFNGNSAATVPGGLNSPAPGFGSGTASVIGGVFAESFLSASNEGGSSDPALGTPPDFAWQTRGYPFQGTNNKTAGVRFFVSTSGWRDITVEFDLRHSNSSSRYEQFQYTTNGTTWNDFGLPFDGNVGDTWFNDRSIDLSSIDGVASNPNFGFRIVSIFRPGSTQYSASDAGTIYNDSANPGGGSWRFDMVQVYGIQIPEPSICVLLLSGITGLLTVRLRRGRRSGHPAICKAIAVVAVLSCYAIESSAEPILWDSADGGNGNRYEVIAGNYSWLQADSIARQMGGHLATITSSQENSFVYGLSKPYWSPLVFPTTWWNYGPWIGAYRPFGPGSDGWTWVTTPDEPFDKTFWARDEPNNELGVETNAHFFTSMSQSGSAGVVTAPTWNDINQQGARNGGTGLPFVVEYESCENVLKGSLSVAEEYTPLPGLPPVPALENGIMAVNFHPKGGIEAAKCACGVERFNFVNKITADPAHFTPYLVKVPSGFQFTNTIRNVPLLNGKPYLGEEFEVEEASYPLVDPPIDGADGRETHLVYLVDTEDFNIPEVSRLLWPINRNQNGDGYRTYYPITYDAPEVVAFLDNPGNHPSLIVPGRDFTAFDTQLVGVTGEGEIIGWKGIGTNWSWKAYSVEDGTRITIDMPGFRQSLEPRNLDFGIRDVRFDNVPEPPSVLLLLIAFAFTRGFHHPHRYFSDHT